MYKHRQLITSQNYVRFTKLQLVPLCSIAKNFANQNFLLNSFVKLGQGDFIFEQWGNIHIS